MAISEDQARVVEVLADVLAKFILAICTAGVFVAFAIVLIFNPSLPIALVESFLVGTIFVVFKHYFPAKG